MRPKVALGAPGARIDVGADADVHAGVGAGDDADENYGTGSSCMRMTHTYGNDMESRRKME